MNHEIWGYAASGGGAKGAWGGGVSDYLTNDLNRNYKYLAGTSTGNLLMGLVSLRKIDLLKTAYTSVNNNDIYSIPPYKIEESKNGVFKTKMNFLKIGWNIFGRKKNTFGDSTRLREKVIPKFFTKSDFDLTRELEKELIATVTNLTLGRTEYKSSITEDMTYEDFCDWIYASACAAPFMSIVEKDNYEYADGGYIESVPIQPLINRGCTHIDVILHRDPEFDIEKIRNPLHLINRIIDITIWENAATDLQLSKLKAKENDVIINIYQPERKLTNNSLVFDKETMEGWWKEGYEFAKSMSCKSYCISKRKKHKLILKKYDTE